MKNLGTWGQTCLLLFFRNRACTLSTSLSNSLASFRYRVMTDVSLNKYPAISCPLYAYSFVYRCVNPLPPEDFLLSHVLPVGSPCLLRIFGEHLQYKLRVYHPASLRSPHIRLMAAPWIGVQSLCDP